MNAERCKAVAINSKSLAEAYVQKKNFGRAFSHFLIAIKLNADWKIGLKQTLSSVLYQWGAVLEKNGRYDDLFKCYEQAIEVFPDNEYILNNLGALLLKYGLVNEAAHYFRRSLNFSPHFLRALRNLENVSNLVVPRWHFRMLNDSKRNGAFREAIRRKISQGFDTVLDIGTGTGILSLFAFEAGAKKITACDSSPYMTEVANHVIRENKADSIRILTKHSSDLKIPDDLPERVKLVVTETVDCGLFGEHILETVIDAWDRLLVPPSADTISQSAVIPLGATLFVAALECESERKKRFPNEAFKFQFGNCQFGYNQESYDSESLNGIRGGFKYLTNVYRTFHINFNDPKAMKKILSGEREEDVVLKCAENGRVDCLVAWFDLNVDEDILLSTAPDSVSCDSWDQAIFPAPDGFNVNRNDIINIKMSFANNKIAFSNFRITPADRTCEFLLNSKQNLFQPSEEVMKILNSVKYRNCFTEIIEEMEKMFEHGVSVLDTFPFPYFGLNLLLQKKHDGNLLTCVVRNEGDRMFLNFIADKYEILNQVRFITEEDLLEPSDEKFDVILLNLIEQTGEIKDKVIAHLESLRSRITRNGLLLPEKITVIGQVVNSEWLERMSRIISDDVTFGYRMGKFLNSYQVKSCIDFNLNSISFTSRSEAFELCPVAAGQSAVNVNVPVSRSGNMNAIVYWFRIGFLNSGRDISTLDDDLTNQSAKLLPRRFVNNSIELRIVYDDGLFEIEYL